jgi:hypothetical protein
MPHRCVRCSKYYEDGSKAILSGCECGGKLFFFIRKEKLEELKKEVEALPLTENDKVELEEDVFHLLGQDPHKDDPVVLDFESIRVLEPGKYELDLVNIFRKEPLIFRLSEGKYVIDLPSTFREFKRK